MNLFTFYHYKIFIQQAQNQKYRKNYKKQVYEININLLFEIHHSQSSANQKSKGMPSYFSPNPQHQWKLLADKQFEQSKLREHQERQLQKQIKQRYLQELSEQIKYKQKSISFEKRLQKSVDRIEVEKSIEEQKRSIEIQKIKNSMIVDRTNKIDEQNIMFEREKKRRQIEIKDLQNQIERSKNQEAQMLLHCQKQNEQKKKQYYRFSLKQSMEKQKQTKKLLQKRQKQLQRAKLYELQQIQQRTDDQRHKGLQKLKERARKVDYGSHSHFEQNQNKTLIQRKSQEWQTYRDAIQRQQILKKMQEQEQIGRKMMENYYHKELKNQITQREQQKRMKSLYQKQRDRSTMDQTEKFGWMVEQQKRQMENQKKKSMHSYLQYQQEHKDNQRRNENAMRQQELKFNLHSLQQNPNSQQLTPLNQKDRRYSTLDVQTSRYYSKPTPGDTFRLDPQRLKQLETISKSIKNSQSFNLNQKIPIDLKSHRYFATKGLSLLS